MELVLIVIIAIAIAILYRRNSPTIKAQREALERKTLR